MSTQSNPVWRLIDRLYFYVKARLPDMGIELSNGQCLPLFQYADDFYLATSVPDHLDFMLAAVGELCYASGMLVNTGQGKTEVVVFRDCQVNCPTGGSVLQASQLRRCRSTSIWGHGLMSMRGLEQICHVVRPLRLSAWEVCTACSEV